MKVTEFEIEGLKLIEPMTYGDHRGFFVERYHQKRFEDAGLPTNFVQDNFSRSAPHVLRGLHYQFEPRQAKLVTCLSGRIFDVAVDIRKNSKTYGHHIAVELSGDVPSWFWIPAGFAHGFCVLGDSPADVLYKVDAHWGQNGESGIIYDDKKLNIPWPIKDPIITDKDRNLQKFEDYSARPAF